MVIMTTISLTITMTLLTTAMMMIKPSHDDGVDYLDAIYNKEVRVVTLMTTVTIMTTSRHLYTK